MPDEMKNNVAQASAWFAAIIGTISLELWLGVAGLCVSAFISYTNYRAKERDKQQKDLQDRLALERHDLIAEEAKRNKELHDLEVERLRRGLNITPAVQHSTVKNLVDETRTQL